MVFRNQNLKKLIFAFSFAGSFFVSCTSLGIPLESKRHLPVSLQSGCEIRSEERTYRVLFLLPIYSHGLDTNSKSNLNQTNLFVLESKSYAKPWDIVFTALGFLLSFNSSTEIKVYCPQSVVFEFLKNEPLADVSNSKLAHWKAEGQTSPLQMVYFIPDDYQITEESKTKLTTLAREILKSEEPYKVILVGKSHTTGDLAYQVRLVKRRFDEVRQVLNKESIDEKRIRTFISDRDLPSSVKENTSDSQSLIQIFLIKE
ncbi:cell envelope biogenesis protein OmpA [Leptospira congkakensis]|uniref:Cell envelope biogenesis protein OmpA n=1 Tax=Leptospira congkakensis TaxID=2484932 RepID=A0A4Z1A465_9LEPT|nr:OmpA family protein [Leptospira congkakensis]TGL88786.1 cell envelope biogenesis protein OmpA [Leptospira congkakensis]TGL89372.1 cell envelope biogenesis protein OmpA [Leptospira congkakensis]TGL97340.1 cell envelope biogenesis protein OmpA [Leptospira congkakensis]